MVFKNIQHIFDDLVLDLSTNKKMARSFRFVFFRNKLQSQGLLTTSFSSPTM